jgi:hypothetical protein
VTFEKHLESKILKALLAIMFMKWPTKFMNYKTHQNVGLGMVGEFETLWKNMILALVKKKCKQMEYILTGKQIKSAVLGGSGLCYKKMQLWLVLMLFLLIYHQFYEAENQLL